MLFDDKISRSDYPKRLDESHYHFLNRSSNQKEIFIRNMINAWLKHLFRHYPENEKKSFISEFKENDIKFNSRFYEIYINNLFKSVGITPNIIHPKIENCTHTVDFHAHNESLDFYSEVKCICGSERKVCNEKHINCFL